MNVVFGRYFPHFTDEEIDISSKVLEITLLVNGSEWVSLPKLGAAHHLVSCLMINDFGDVTCGGA